jgi:hypothetical protein
MIQRMVDESGSYYFAKIPLCIFRHGNAGYLTVNKCISSNASNAVWYNNTGERVVEKCIKTKRHFGSFLIVVDLPDSQRGIIDKLEGRMAPEKRRSLVKRLDPGSALLDDVSNVLDNIAEITALYVRRKDGTPAGRFRQAGVHTSRLAPGCLHLAVVKKSGRF